MQNKHYFQVHMGHSPRLTICWVIKKKSLNNLKVSKSRRVSAVTKTRIKLEFSNRKISGKFLNI